jgi:8-oxo-dGTP diphosphatase
VAFRDGDGWVECICGVRHWGKHGAAGILLLRDNKVLMQHRAEWVQNGGTWGIPGGACDSHESSLEGAIREANEEVGICAEEISVVRIEREAHGDWFYDTVIAYALDNCEPFTANDESQELRWVNREDVALLNLHPSFARNWGKLQANLP